MTEEDVDGDIVIIIMIDSNVKYNLEWTGVLNFQSSHECVMFTDVHLLCSKALTCTGAFEF